MRNEDLGAWVHPQDIPLVLNVFPSGQPPSVCWGPAILKLSPLLHDGRGQERYISQEPHATDQLSICFLLCA